MPIERIPFCHIGRREIHAREAFRQGLPEGHLKQTWADLQPFVDLFWLIFG